MSRIKLKLYFYLFILAAFIVPIMVVSFQGHKMLFSFDYRSLEHDGNGAIDFKFLFKAEAIQFFFICLTFFVISFIEAKYNKLDLRVVYKSKVRWKFFRGLLFSFGVYSSCCRPRRCYQDLKIVIKMTYVLASLTSIKLNMVAIKTQPSMKGGFE